MDSIVNIRGVAPGATPGSTQARANSAGKAVPAGGKDLPVAREAPPTPERLAQAVQQIQTYLNDMQRQLQFQVDQGSGRTIVRVVNPETKELIRQIPSEEVLKLAAAIGAQGGQVISELV